MFGGNLSHCVEVYLRTCFRHINKEFFCKRTVLNVFQNFLHCFLRFFRDNLRTRNVVAVFSRVGNRISHTFKTALVDKVNDEFHFVDTFKVCVSGVVTCFYKRFKTCLHQGANTAAKYSLFTEKVGFRFRTEVGFQNTCSCAADTCRVCKTDFPSVARSVLFHCDKARYAFTCLIFTTYRMARAFGCDHDNVYVLRGFDATEVNVKAVRKCKRLTFRKVGFDAFFVQFCLLFIVDKDHDNVSRCRCFCRRHNFHALLFSFFPALAALVKTNNNVHARIFQVKCVCMALGAVTDNCNGLAVKLVQITILLIENSVCHNNLPVLFYVYFYFFIFIICSKALSYPYRVLPHPYGTFPKYQKAA